MALIVLTEPLPEVVAKQRRDGEWNIYEKSRKSTTKVKSLWTETEVISEKGTMELGELGLAEAFEHPKPCALIKKCIEVALDAEGMVLDFFAGSGTTAQAVLELNARDCGNRRFVLVQLPEPAERKGFSTIPDWAIVREDENRQNKVYLVRETKGTNVWLKVPEIQRKKIQCGKAHFKAVGLKPGEYDWVASAKEL